jgi:hypothetical protein
MVIDIQSSLVNPDASSSDSFSREQNFYSLFCIINLEICIPDPDSHFLTQNIEMYRKSYR